MPVSLLYIHSSVGVWHPVRKINVFRPRLTRKPPSFPSTKIKGEKYNVHVIIQYTYMYNQRPHERSLTNLYVDAYCYIFISISYYLKFKWIKYDLYKIGSWWISWWIEYNFFTYIYGSIYQAYANYCSPQCFSLINEFMTFLKSKQTERLKITFSNMN